jgi:hypothetical protein
MRLIGTESLDEIMETAIYSGYIRDSIPTSILIVGPSGGGKSKTLLRFESESIYRCDDLTSSGLFDILDKDRNEKISHFMLPDFNPVLSHKPSTTNLTVASMLSLMSDGTAEIADGRETKKLKHRPIGFLTAATSEMYMKHLKHWAAIGLIRRFVPVFFRYTESTIQKAQTAISDGKINLLAPDLYKIIKRQPAIPLIDEKHAVKLETYAVTMGYNLGYRFRPVTDKGIKSMKWITDEHSKILPMSPQLVLQTLIRSHALRDNRTKTTEKDLEFISHLIDFTNPQHPVSL